MSKPKWTPGPWRVERRAEDEWWIMAGDTLVAVVYADDADEGQANASLFAAAKDLYNDLSELGDYTLFLLHECLGYAKEDAEKQLEPFMESLRKARGE